MTAVSVEVWRWTPVSLLRMPFEDIVAVPVGTGVVVVVGNSKNVKTTGLVAVHEMTLWEILPTYSG